MNRRFQFSTRRFLGAIGLLCVACAISRLWAFESDFMNRVSAVAVMAVTLALSAGVLIGRPGRFAAGAIVVVAGVLPGLWLARWWEFPRVGVGSRGCEHTTLTEEVTEWPGGWAEWRYTETVWPDTPQERRRTWIEWKQTKN